MTHAGLQLKWKGTSAVAFGGKLLLFREKTLRNLETAMQRCVDKVVTTSKAIVPVDTGRLRASIAGTVRRENAKLYFFVGSEVEYAPFVELGTSRMSAQPYLQPSIDQNIDYIVSQFEGAVATGVKTV